MLLEKIKSKNSIISVIGLGYVGLPIALEAAKSGYKVIGLDINKSRVQMIKNGISYMLDIESDDLCQVVKNGNLLVSNDYKLLENVDCVIICVPTPLDKYKAPDMTFIETAAKKLSKYLHEEMLVVLESTTYPGTTEEYLLPIFESTGLKCGEEFYLAYSPERVDPGNNRKIIKNTLKVIGGITKVCTNLTAAFYENVFKCKTYTVSCPKVAELTKLYENTYRYVNIALANEMAIVCGKMNIDIWEVIDAANTKPYGFQAFYPGPGVGGHCIPVDPMYLSWKTKEYDYSIKLIDIADEINRNMPNFVLEKIRNILNKENKPLKNSNILLLGVAYKQDIDDIRESSALRVMDLLQKEGAIVEYYDPYIPNFRWGRSICNSIKLTNEKVKEKDIVVITTAHTNIDYDMVLENAKIVFDTKNVTRYVHSNRHKLIKL